MENLNYIDLFSGGGIGSYELNKNNGFNCVLSSEIIKRRLELQILNKKCDNKDAYICGDISEDKIKKKIEEIIKGTTIDILISTPPCQGMSVANHKKKKDEIKRNSLILESINFVLKYKPKLFIFENVRSFLKTACTDNDGKTKTIEEVIYNNLTSQYNINSKIINFANYGSNSNRTRTLVLGTLKKIDILKPHLLFPSQKKSKNLYELIGSMRRLSEFGEGDPNDFLHNFRKYDERMLPWIEKIKEGQSAFDQIEKTRIPSRIINGKIVYNKNKNSDKYRRCIWTKPAPCIHTRNDILASQSTIHPEDNRVFSIRELMILMNIPAKFKWFQYSNNQNLNSQLLRKNEINIRQCIGESIPCNILKEISLNLKRLTQISSLDNAELKKISLKLKNSSFSSFLKSNINNYSFYDLSKIREINNENKKSTAAYYTNPLVVKDIIDHLPEFKKKKITILEPSCGTGNFIPFLIERYKNKNVELYINDIDINSIKITREIIKKLYIPKNFKINFLNKDFIDLDEKLYDLIITNPPFGFLKNSLSQNEKHYSKICKTKNIFALFLLKSLKMSKFVSFILPKALINSPEYRELRKIIEKLNIKCIFDFGQKAFNGVLIETIAIIIETSSKCSSNEILIKSWIENNSFIKKQSYVCDNFFPNWLIYRNNFFDKISKSLEFNVFDFYRDRNITKKHSTLIKNKIRILKSRNVGNNRITNLINYDSYLKLDMLKEINKRTLNFLNDQSNNYYIIPNLSYYPRAAKLPKNTICDGSVAIIWEKNNNSIVKSDLTFFSSEEFKLFYSLARNKSSRSLNIDKCSIFFWGIKKKKQHELF